VRAIDQAALFKVGVKFYQHADAAIRRAESKPEPKRDPDPIRRNVFNKNSLVLSALPPIENRRLSSQQGTFLFNAAESLTFEESLSKMMKGHNDWYQRFEFAESALADAEARLFQMNINDLSLFPDIEGVAGYVRQKARLLWGAN
jgi:hypothetical protein